MYSKDFYITDPVGNNAFSFAERKNKQLFVPKLKKIERFDEIELLDSPPTPLQERGVKKITFEEYNFEGVMQTCYGLKYLYELDYFSHNTSPSIPLLQGEGSRKIPLYLVDNHNHVFYFWYLARSQGIISDGARLYHIDEHADTRDSGEYLRKPDSWDIEKVFQYANFTLNVGNYIIPAQKEGLIGEVVQIRGEEALREYISSSQPSPKGEGVKNIPLSFRRGGRGEDFSGREKKSIILNLDLDFFEPELDFIDYDLKKQVILDIAQKADLITVCTSPYFINQQRALEVFKDIFGK